VAHHVVAHFPLPGLGHLVVDVVLMALQLLNLLFGDGKPQPVLGLRQRNPQPAPGAELLLLRKEILHLVAGVTGGKGADIALMHEKTSVVLESLKHRRG